MRHARLLSLGDLDGATTRPTGDAIGTEGWYGFDMGSHALAPPRRVRRRREPLVVGLGRHPVAE